MREIYTYIHSVDHLCHKERGVEQFIRAQIYVIFTVQNTIKFYKSVLSSLHIKNSSTQ